MITNNFSIKVNRISLNKSIIRINNRYKHKKFLQRYLNYYVLCWRLKFFLPFGQVLGAFPLNFIICKIINEKMSVLNIIASPLLFEIITNIKNINFNKYLRFISIIF